MNDTTVKIPYCGTTFIVNGSVARSDKNPNICYFEDPRWRVADGAWVDGGEKFNVKTLLELADQEVTKNVPEGIYNVCI